MSEKSAIMEALANVEDPELFMSIVDLGLVYRVEVQDDKVEIDYTLTSPGCPLSDIIEADIVKNLGEVTELPVHAQLVWEPMWIPDFMTEEAKLSLGYPI
jgi:metal-sulfur cluster biosynthetic enzyme